MHHIPPSLDRLLVNFSQEIAGLSYGPVDSIAGSWDLTEPWFCFITQRGLLGPRGLVGIRTSFLEPGGRI